MSEVERELTTEECDAIRADMLAEVVETRCRLLKLRRKIDPGIFDVMMRQQLLLEALFAAMDGWLEPEDEDA